MCRANGCSFGGKSSFSLEMKQLGSAMSGNTYSNYNNRSSTHYNQILLAQLQFNYNRTKSVLRTNDLLFPTVKTTVEKILLFKNNGNLIKKQN